MCCFAFAFPPGSSQGVALAHRDQLLGWLVETFTVLSFGEDMLHQAVLTIDRYAAAISPTPIPVEELVTAPRRARLHLETFEFLNAKVKK